MKSIRKGTEDEEIAEDDVVLECGIGAVLSEVRDFVVGLL